MSKPLTPEQVSAALRFYELALAPICKPAPSPGTPEQSAVTPQPSRNPQPEIAGE